MRIERDFLKRLQEWKDSPRRKPLILKGVRQCGKTWLLRHFGQGHFAGVAEFNFDKDKNLASFFDGPCDARRIVAQLAAYAGQPIPPGKTLIFFDEIQTCPAALMALKYFCEDAPEYHVAAAGSCGASAPALRMPS